MVYLLLAFGLPATAADKVDVVQLRNGDRLTCEIKKLDRSVLTISTDPLGKASVHWGDIATLTSPRMFDLQLTSGEHYLGTLVAASAGSVGVAVDGSGTLEFALDDIVRLAAIGGSLWSRTDGSVDAGFSFSQADLETRWTLNGSGSYRGPRYQFSGTIASQITIREDADPISRNTLSLTGIRSYGNRWYAVGWGQFQENQELSLDLRVVGGGGFGRDLALSDSHLFSLYSGLTYNNEHFSGDPPGQSAEAAVGAQLDFYSPGHEDFLITNSILSYYALTGRARVRIELQSAWRREFLKDFYWSISGFDSYDSSPPQNLKTNDAGISVTLGWKF